MSVSEFIAKISGGSVDQLYRGIVDTVRQGAFGLEDVLPFVTTNPARALKLASKGRLEEGADADVLLIDKATLAVAHVVARGRALVRDGRFVEEISE